MIVIHKDRLKCPECGANMVPAISITGAESDFYMACTKCATFVDTYIPLPHQEAFHIDPTRYTAMASGYGTGKTLADVKEREKHILITPKGESLVGAVVLNQVEATFKKDFERDFPLSLVKHYNKQKNEIKFINEHLLMYRPLYDEGVLRSLNLTGFTIVEASEVKHVMFVQLQTRLRNHHGMIPETDENGNLIYELNEDTGEYQIKVKYDWRKGTLESNPDAGWIRDEFLLKSNRIYLHGEELFDQEYHVPPHQANEFMSTHIVPTAANPHLPPNYIKEVSRGKAAWWVKRYIFGSFEYAEGLVYPEALRTVCNPVEIKRNWQHVIAADYGINDFTVILFGAIDPANYILYIYNEIVVNRMNVKEIARIYKEDLKKFIPLGGLLSTPVMDAKSLSKPGSSNDVDRTLGDLFLDEGLLFKPAKMNLQARIMHTNTLIEVGQIRIFKTCSYLISEILKYKFPEKSLEKTTKATDKPEDKNNHAVNALEFMCMELPPNLKSLTFTGLYGNGTPIEAYLGEKRDRLEEVYNPFQSRETFNPLTDNPYYESIYKGGF